MIPCVVFNKDWRCFARDTFIGFAPGVTLLVGDQGCGKSSLLSQMALWISQKKREDRSGLSPEDLAVTTFWMGKPGRSGYFDLERNNPRTAPAFDMYGIDIATQVHAMRGSHGEFTRQFLSIIKDLGFGTLFLDEPDMALSPRSIYRLVDNLKEAADKGAQIVASVHNPLLIALFPEVMSLEHGRWMPSHEYLELVATTESTVHPKGPRRIDAPHSTTADLIDSDLKKDEVTKVG